MSILAALVPSRFLYYTDIIKSKEGTLMTKQEISEIKKLFTPKNCSITRICGCYVDGEKNKKTELKQAFLALPEEEMFKYFEILRKSLSGTIGKNLLNLEFPLKSETEGGTQEFLLRLRDSRLKDDALLEQFYDRIIESYEYVGNYLTVSYTHLDVYKRQHHTGIQRISDGNAVQIQSCEHQKQHCCHRLHHQRDPRIDDRGIDFAKSLQNRTVQSRQCIKDNRQ